MYKKISKNYLLYIINGADSEIRTQDLLITSQPHYRAMQRRQVVIQGICISFICVSTSIQDKMLEQKPSYERLLSLSRPLIAFYLCDTYIIGDAIGAVVNYQSR